MSFCTIVSFLILVAALCGSPTAAVDSRIVNGQIANTGQIPYQASLRNSAGTHVCGGSVINVFWVLTAAQCFTFAPIVTIKVGSNSLSSGGTIYQVATRISHPLFNSATLAYDAGLIKTTTFILFSFSVMPVVLANIPPVVNAFGVVSGWGSTTYPSSTLSPVLRYLNTNVISYANCQSQVSSLGFTLQPTNICTFKPSAGDCIADDGGPLVVSFVQYGIVSVYACGLGFADAYTSVPTVYNWIMSTIATNTVG